MGSEAETIEAVVREHDRVRYLTALYAPEEHRRHLLALYAFHAEITRVPDLVNEPMPGEIRLQWWRDVLTGGTTTETQGHPVAAAVKEAVSAHGLPIQSLLDMIDARAGDFYADRFSSQNDLEAYCGETASALFQLSILIGSPENAPRSADASGHGGCAWEITRLLGRLSLDRRKGKCSVPLDILASVGTDADTFSTGSVGESHLRAVSAMSALAREHLARFESAISDLEKPSQLIFLPASLVSGRLKRIESLGNDVFEKPLKPAPVREQFTLMCRSITGW